MEETRLFVGHDESNNGRPLEIHTGVFSLFPPDIVYTPLIMDKRRSHQDLFTRLEKRDYRFVQFSKLDKARLEVKDERLGIIVSSLLAGFEDLHDLDSLDLYLDGSRSKSEICYLRDCVSDYLSFPRKNIDVQSGAKFDQHYFLVNIADQLANYLYRCGEILRQNNPKRVELIK